jgi:toxin-antitoxin system PIN domain toxin
LILVDTNLLLYASVGDFPQHERARLWLDERLNGAAPVGLPWASLLGFLRIITNTRVFRRPTRTAEAWRQVCTWLDSERAWIPQPTERHRDILGGLLAGSDVQANLVHDAHLAALAIEHGLILCSTDGDFGRFDGLRWENPLQVEASARK